MATRRPTRRPARARRPNTARKLTLAGIKAANKAAGQHWFDKGTMAFFKTRVEAGPYTNRKFVTSEQGPDGVRRYSVRLAKSDGRIETVGTFQGYSTKASAVAAAQGKAHAPRSRPAAHEDMDYEVGARQRRANPPRRPAAVDEHAVTELVLYATNDSTLYRQRAEPIIANLRKKIAKGTYNKELAVKAWQYLADAAAQKYTREFSGRGSTSYGIFGVAERRAAARQILEHYDEEVRHRSNPKGGRGKYLGFKETKEARGWSTRSTQSKAMRKLAAPTRGVLYVKKRKK